MGTQPPNKYVNRQIYANLRQSTPAYANLRQSTPIYANLRQSTHYPLYHIYILCFIYPSGSASVRNRQYSPKAPPSKVP